MGNRYRSVFDIIGPVMIGPSSSHTAGAVAIGRVARELFRGAFNQVTVRYYDSFAETHRGHGTDYAVISGLLGFDPADRRVPIALDLARRLGIQITFIEEKQPSPIGHPNTAQITLSDGQEKLTVWGCSIGGGVIEIRQVDFGGMCFNLQGPLPVLFIEATQDISVPLKQLFSSDWRMPLAMLKHGNHYRYVIELDTIPAIELLKQARKISTTLVLL